MKIEEHVFLGIEAFLRGEQEHALLHACIAIDGTSQKRKGSLSSEKTEYIKFIRDYYWILEPMTGSGIDFDKTFWKNVEIHDQKKDKNLQEIDIAKFIYYIFRCAQVHGKSIEAHYKLVPRDSDGTLSYHIAKDRLHIPETIIWGLLSICVFAKVNADIETKTGHNFSLGGNVFSISDWWGLEDSFRPIATKHNTVRVALQELYFSEITALNIENA